MGPGTCWGASEQGAEAAPPQATDRCAGQRREGAKDPGHSVDSRWWGRCGGRRRQRWYRWQQGWGQARGGRAVLPDDTFWFLRFPLPPPLLGIWDRRCLVSICPRPGQVWEGRQRPAHGQGSQAHTGHRVTTPKATVDGHPHAPSLWPLGHPTGKSEPPKAQARAPPGCVSGQNSMGTDRVSPPRLACHSPWGHPWWSLPVCQ